MAFWLYQMTNDEWSQEQYRTEVWEGNNTTWQFGTISPAGSSPQLGDTMVLFYARSGGDPGIYGWAVILRYQDKEVYFRPAPPSDYLKMNPLWNDTVSDTIDKIRGRRKRGTMWEIDFELMRSLREEIAKYV